MAITLTGSTPSAASFTAAYKAATSGGSSSSGGGSSSSSSKLPAAGQTAYNSAGQMINSAGDVVGGAVTKSGMISYDGTNAIPGSANAYTSAGRGGIANLAPMSPTTPVTSTAIAPNSLVSVPSQTAQTGAPDISSIYASLGLGSNGQSLATPKATAEASTTTGPTMSELIAYQMGNAPKPESRTDIYNNLDEKRQVEQAQRDLNTYTNQLNAITANRDANLLRVRGIGSEQGVTEAVYGGQAATINREAAIAALPVAAQVAAAQGNLQLAQQHLDTQFKLRVADAEADYDYKNKLYDSVVGYLTKAEQRVYDEKKNAISNAFETEKINLVTIRELQKEAIAAGNLSLLTSVSALDPKDPNFNRQYSNLASGLIVPSEASTDNANLDAYAAQYETTGTLPSATDMRNAGITAGQIALAAKEAPKREGALVSMSTGVKPSKMTGEQQQGVVDAYDVVQKLDRAEELYKELNTGLVAGLGKTIFYTSRQQEYDNLKSEIVDLIARDRTGAVLNAEEQKTYGKKLPGRFNETLFLGADGDEKIRNLRSSIEGKLNTALNKDGLVIYGYSKVNVGGTPRTVGEVILIGDKQWRVLPDGNLTDKI
jgi:hypothetical protein